MNKTIDTKNINIGAWCTVAHPEVAEAMLSTKLFNWLAIDYEHSSPATENIVKVFQTCNQYNVTPFVRILGHDPFFARKMLDLGAAGIILPVLDNIQQLNNFLEHIYYPPKGKRGFCLSRMNEWGDNFEKYLTSFSPIIIPQIESKEGAKNIMEIINHPDVSGIFVGPYDLSGSLGTPGQFETKEFTTLLKNIIQSTKQNNKLLGFHLVEPTAELLQAKISDGYNFIAYGTDMICLRHPLLISKKIIKENK